MRKLTEVSRLGRAAFAFGSYGEPWGYSEPRRTAGTRGTQEACALAFLLVVSAAQMS